MPIGRAIFSAEKRRRTRDLPAGLTRLATRGKLAGRAAQAPASGNEEGA